MSLTTALSDCSAKRCQVVSLNLTGATAQRLEALGIFEGQDMKLAKRGNPLIVKAAGGKVAISRDLASQILVRAVVE
ncbi:MAG: FeoA family protein [Lentisphaeria bacterium]|jgi:Fe2+ transport system protein FeoA|nr:FeoA family protein [Lentisphaeria bacterium]MDP7742621.1 FeoA family protein [Lentisphaeria bacterium]